MLWLDFKCTVSPLFPGFMRTGLLYFNPTRDVLVYYPPLFYNCLIPEFLSGAASNKTNGTTF